MRHVCVFTCTRLYLPDFRTPHHLSLFFLLPPLSSEYDGTGARVFVESKFYILFYFFQAFGWVSDSMFGYRTDYPLFFPKNPKILKFKQFLRILGILKFWNIEQVNFEIVERLSKYEMWNLRDRVAIFEKNQNFDENFGILNCSRNNKIVRLLKVGRIMIEERETVNGARRERYIYIYFACISSNGWCRYRQMESVTQG